MIKNRSIILIWYLISLIVFFVKSSLGQGCFDVKTDSLIQTGIEFSIQHDYEKAESVFQQLIEDYPNHPVGYFFMAATIQTKMMDYESDRWSQDFFKYIHLAIEYAEKDKFNKREDEIRAMFYHGSALCYLAFYEGRNGDYLKALRHGLSGISIIKKVIKINPEFRDAYFGIGSYKYWRSQKTKFLNWLPFVSDDREEGIDMVRQAIEKGKYTRYAAMNELIWILLDWGNADEAYSWALRGLEKFPQSRFFLWGAAKSAVALEDYTNAVIHFQELLQSIINAPFNNYYNEYLCRVKLVQCFEKLERYSDASYQMEILESLPLAPEIEAKLKRQQKELSQLKKKLSLIAKQRCPADSLVSKYDFTDEQRSQ